MSGAEGGSNGVSAADVDWSGGSVPEGAGAGSAVLVFFVRAKVRYASSSHSVMCIADTITTRLDAILKHMSSRDGWTSYTVCTNNRMGSVPPPLDERYACFPLKIDASRIHGWGVYAAAQIPAGRKVMEYTGERINRAETKIRLKSVFHFIFNLDGYWALDGASGGSGAQYVNHCCDPNLRAWICQGHILYMSKRVIEPGEELTLDYKFRRRVNKHICLCGSPKCRGSIEVV